jgi:hypothetical protein
MSWPTALPLHLSGYAKTSTSKIITARDLGYLALIEFTRGVKGRPLAIYSDCFMGASDSDGSGFSVTLTIAEARRLAQALRIAPTMYGVMGAWNGKVSLNRWDYPWSHATHGSLSDTVVTSIPIKFPDLLRWLLANRARFGTEVIVCDGIARKYGGDWYREPTNQHLVNAWALQRAVWNERLCAVEYV